jgi:acyl-CoA reductase-like NAD-dependent aldehyde dehydrogenase
MAVEQQVGSDRGGVATIEVHNPATGAIIRSVPDMSASQVRELVARGRAVQRAWNALGFEGRKRLLRRAQKWIVDNARRVTDTLMAETGKTYEDAFTAEIAYCAFAFGFWAKNAAKYLAEQRVRTSNPLVIGTKLIVRYEPLGVVGVIGPWNYPLVNSFGDCIPALAAGNAVVLKPSEYTPLTSLVMVDALRECGFPDDVYQVATGTGGTGTALIDEVDYVMFTGSTATGKKIMERAARTLTPVSLELGGKDPMIVLRDVDLERAANTAVWCSMQNSGQTCLSIERVYVEEPIYDEFVAKVVAKVRALRQGPPQGPASTEVGAMTMPGQVDIVERHVQDAINKGARVLTGGHARRENGSFFFEPTVLVDVDHTMACMCEETFGPTLPIMKVRDAEEAIQLANDSPFGLAGCVFTGDRRRGEALARRLRAGVTSVNSALAHFLALEVPMGGWKDSGLGSRHGPHGIQKYCKEQTLAVQVLPRKRELYMFPYRARTTRFIETATKLIWGRGKRR